MYTDMWVHRQQKHLQSMSVVMKAGKNVPHVMNVMNVMGVLNVIDVLNAHNKTGRWPLSFEKNDVLLYLCCQPQPWRAGSTPSPHTKHESLCAYFIPPTGT